MTSSEKKQLQITACKVRMGVIESTYGAKAGHPGGSLSAAEVYTYLYFKEMNVDPENPAKTLSGDVVTKRVRRGGDWGSIATASRPAFRSSGEPNVRSTNCGLRVVCSAGLR